MIHWPYDLGLSRYPVKLSLPLAPSMNALWRSVNGRVIKSKQYREWIEEAGYALLSQRPKAIDGPYNLGIFVNPGMRGDIDNRIKGVLDLLVTHGVTADDSKANSILIERIGPIEKGTMLVCAEPAKFDRPLCEMLKDAGLSIPSTTKDKATGNA